ncbi:ANTAR domain-containing response regulator [Paenibacillus piri]|uniref:ANTAR domain-containing protein n=1 Tax=Paenibacillus piri TaxID=2547395 RepID=A0A4R5KFI1_9BACL|nr:ANTAR domain-containing protein [Paenibacillus piri]TDF93722.1 ANTAR domain-containing protein [Paenibacillus piri]
MKSILVYFPDSSYRPTDSAIGKLNSIGLDVLSVYTTEDFPASAGGLDGIIVCCTEKSLNSWLELLMRQFELPVWWWCQSPGFLSKIQYPIEGVLTGGMSPAELQWALVVGLNNYDNRRSAKLQIEQLQEKLDERKLIERAKGILAKTTGMSEDEAFKYLRNKAMKERKKMAVISGTIVDLYGPLLER